MTQIEKNMYKSRANGEKHFAWLIDPDKLSTKSLNDQLDFAKNYPPDYIFLGGSLMIKDQINHFIQRIKATLDIPVILFPGSINQVNDHADGILLLSLISGRNPDFLIGRHVEVAFLLKQSSLQVLPTAYMLVDSGRHTTASYISNTIPLPYDKVDIAVSTAIAGELLGLRIMFLDGGSGAMNPVSEEMIQAVRKNVNAPLIVGGGIRSASNMKKAFDAGADIVVIGNSIEKDTHLLKEFYELTRKYKIQS
jgi:phosphoglycerol geranylgeranyltransferase